MFRYLQSRTQPPKVAPDPGAVSLRQLVGDAKLPLSLHSINELPEPVRSRLYRSLVPPALLLARSWLVGWTWLQVGAPAAQLLRRRVALPHPLPGESMRVEALSLPEPRWKRPETAAGNRHAAGERSGVERRSSQLRRPAQVRPED